MKPHEYEITLTSRCAIYRELLRIEREKLSEGALQHRVPTLEQLQEFAKELDLSLVLKLTERCVELVNTSEV